MVRYSVLLPEREAGDALARQLPDLRRVLNLLALPYEIVCIDDASSPTNCDTLRRLAGQHPPLRVLRLDRPAGMSAALSAGITAARGEVLVAMAAGQEYSADQIPHLIAALSRGDLVCGCRRREGWAGARHRLALLPRQMLLGHEVHDPDCRFWAARREAVAGLELPRGGSRYLATLVSMRGFRVAEVTVAHDVDGRASDPQWSADGWPNPGDLLCTWWQRRRSRIAKVEELSADGHAVEAAPPATHVRWGQPPSEPHSPIRRRDSA